MSFSAVFRRPGKTWVGKALRSPLALIPRDMVMPVLQGPLRGRKWIVGSCVHACWLGRYEAPESAQIATAVMPGWVFFDIGAQAGYHTLLASQLVGSAGRVFAFEPVPANVANLRRHIELNGLRNVSVLEAAVSDTAGTVHFDQGINAVSGHIAADGRLSVRSLTLDDEIERGALPEPHFIKIDVEGAECAVLKGARRLLLRRHPILLIETHQWMSAHESCFRDCTQLLEAAGYEFLPQAESVPNSNYHISARLPRQERRERWDARAVI